MDDLDDSARWVVMIAYGLSIINELLLDFPGRFASPATELWVNRRKTHLCIFTPEGAHSNLSLNAAIFAKNGNAARGNFIGLLEMHNLNH